MGDLSSVRALERGLKLITLLNKYNGLTVTQIGKLSKLPRPTAYRLLRTLESMGYIFRDDRDKNYRLSSKVRSLSHGYDQEEWITKISRPIIIALCNKILWPIAVGTVSGANILIRDTTDDLSPYALNRLRGGFHISLINTASGMVYLAFCNEEKSSELLNYALKRCPDGFSSLGTNEAHFMESLSDIKRKGFACFPTKGQNHGVLAFPIIVDDNIFATLSMRFMLSALTINQATERYCFQLGQAAKEIGEKIEIWINDTG